MHPDAKDALLLDPIKKLIRGDRLATLWPTFSPRVQKRARDLWQRGKLVTLERICGIVQKLGESLADFEAELNNSPTPQIRSGRKKPVRSIVTLC